MKNSAVIILVFIAGFSLGIRYEKNNTLVKHNEELQDILTKKQEIEKRNIEFLEEQEILKDEIIKQKNSYEHTINSLGSSYASRLYESEERGNLYRRRAEASKAECGVLAEHATQLDRAITEGRQLVKELTEYSKQCRIVYDQSIQYLINYGNHLNGWQ